jgi:uncharacterized protein (TIGR02284 family)
MVTTIGLNPDFHVVLKSLIALDYDAVEAYQAAIERVENAEYKKQLTEFKADHERHISELSEVARMLGLEPPTGPDMKVSLAKGKVIMMDIFGDKAILMAMKTNEEDTNTAYERAFNHKDLDSLAREAVNRGFVDERRHRAWIVDTLEKISHKAA